MQDSEYGHSNIEFRLARLVVPYEHSEQGPDAAAEKNGKKDKEGFGYPPFAFAGFVLINAIDDKCQKIYNDQIACQYHTEIIAKICHADKTILLHNCPISKRDKRPQML